MRVLPGVRLVEDMDHTLRSDGLRDKNRREQVLEGRCYKGNLIGDC